VTTFQTLAAAARNPSREARGRLEQFLAGFDGVFVDECHVLPAQSFWRVAMMLGNAHWRIGLSATPLDREDKRSVYAVGALGPVVYKIGAQQLIAEGRLARPTIRLAKVQQEFREVDAMGLPKRWPWQKVYEEGVVRSGVRNRTLLAATQRAEKPALVFVKDLAHGKAFARALEKRGVRSDFVWGSASLRTRQDAVRRLERGDLEVLVCSVIFQEGVDIPELRSVVIASAGKSVIAALQRIGRGMRTAAGKDTFEVWDVADEGNAWLARHAKARRRAYQREGYQVATVQLPESPSPDAGKP
jgi:superfamily II DNA or RNA helicase